MNPSCKHFPHFRIQGTFSIDCCWNIIFIHPNTWIKFTKKNIAHKLAFLYLFIFFLQHKKKPSIKIHIFLSCKFIWIIFLFLLQYWIFHIIRKPLMYHIQHIIYIYIFYEAIGEIMLQKNHIWICLFMRSKCKLK